MQPGGDSFARPAGPWFAKDPRGLPEGRQVRERLDDLERQLAAVGFETDADDIAVADLAGEDLAAERGLHFALDRSFAFVALRI